jgi:hypothetical protein
VNLCYDQDNSREIGQEKYVRLLCKILKTRSQHTFFIIELIKSIYLANKNLEILKESEIIKEATILLKNESTEKKEKSVICDLLRIISRDDQSFVEYK